MLPDKNDIAIYIHIPFCISKCRYCDFVSAKGTESEMDAYVDALIKEIKGAKQFASYHVTSIYFGGGTPSLLSIENFTKIVNALEETFGLKRQYKDIGPFSINGNTKGKIGFYLNNAVRDLKNQVEFTVECNPDTVSPEKFKAYKKLGVNRISFGLQSNNNKDLKLLGRTYDVDCFTNAFFAARDAGMENINIDLIQAIPGQSTLEFMKSLYSIMMLGPDHISTYSLIVEEGTPFYDMTSTDEKGNRIFTDTDGSVIAYPTEEEDRDIYNTAAGFLNSAGITRYEISNFSKKDRECRHNIAYWQRQNYIGFGISAASMVDNIRWKNIEDRDKYVLFFNSDNNGFMSGHEGPANFLPAIGDIKNHIVKDYLEKHMAIIKEDEINVLSHKEQMSEFMFLGLRMSKGVAKEEFMEEFGVDFDFQYGDITQKFIDEGLLEIKEFEFFDPVKKTDYVKTRIFLTDRGIDISNQVMAEYMI